MIQKTATLGAVLTLTSPLSAQADATRMCLDRSGTSEAQCICATEALASAIGPQDADLYETVRSLYLANKAAGQGMGDAWDAAIARTAEDTGLGRTGLLTRMNAAGIAHRAAIKECE